MVQFRFLGVEELTGSKELTIGQQRSYSGRSGTRRKDRKSGRALRYGFDP